MTKTVTFKKIQLEGFGSFERRTSFDLDRGGVFLIKGLTGAGKTTIFSALSWACFKVPLKDIANDRVATWERLRSPEYRGTRVAVFFDVEDGQYMVARHLDYKGSTLGLKAGSKLMIFKKQDPSRGFAVEDLVGEAQHKGDMQDYINRLLGVDAKAFLNSILFGQRMQRLIESDNKDKRALFESLFDVDFIAAAKEKAVLKIAECTTKISGYVKDIEVNEAKVTTTNEQITSGEEVQKNFETTKKERIATVEAELKDEETALTAAKKEQKTQKALADKYDTKKVKELSDIIAIKELAADQAKELYEASEKTQKATDKSLKNAEDLLADYKQQLLDIKTTCTVCGQSLKPDQLEAAKKKLKDLITAEELVIKQLTDKKKLLDPKVKTEKELREQADRELGEAEDKLTEYETKAASYKKAFDGMTHYDKAVTDAYDRVEKVKTRLQKEQDAKPPVLDLAALRKKVTDSEQLITELKADKEKEAAEKVRLEWWSKKGFGAGGLKSFVFNAMLNQLNICLDKYSSRLGVSVRFSIDLTKESKPFIASCYKGEHEILYEELSGGQKQKVDACIAFAMHDVVSSKTNFNILLLDEIFEGLDSACVSAVFDLINMKVTAGSTVFVITHIKTLESLQSKTINIEQDERELSYIK